MRVCLPHLHWPHTAPTATQLGFLIPSWTKTLPRLKIPSGLMTRWRMQEEVILIHINIFTNMLGDEPKIPIRLMICTTQSGVWFTLRTGWLIMAQRHVIYCIWMTIGYMLILFLCIWAEDVCCNEPFSVIILSPQCQASLARAWC